MLTAPIQKLSAESLRRSRDVGQVVNLRRIGNPPVEACIRPSASGLITPPQDAILPHESLLPNTPPIRFSTHPRPSRSVGLLRDNPLHSIENQFRNAVQSEFLQNMSEERRVGKER